MMKQSLLCATPSGVAAIPDWFFNLSLILKRTRVILAHIRVSTHAGKRIAEKELVRQ